MQATSRLLVSGIALCASMPAHAEMSFNRVATFATPLNMAAGEDTNRPSSAEIISATEDGMTLIYTDSPLGVEGVKVKNVQTGAHAAWQYCDGG